MQQERKIDYVEMPAADMQATREFFNGLFGWQFTEYGPDYMDFTDGRIAGGFRRSTVSMDAEAGSALVVFYAKDLESLEARIRELGGVISTATFSFPGGRRFHFRDPNGNEFAVWSDQ